MTAQSIARSLPPVYAAAALRLAFPLLMLPVMAGRLGAVEFGRLSLLLVWAGLLAMLVEGGFLAAATRLAVVADAPGRWRLAQQVFSARCLLSALAVGLSAPVVPLLLSDASIGDQAVDALLLASLACALGWPATWYLQAAQQLHRWAWVEMAVYAAWLLAVAGLGHSVFSYLLLNLIAAVLLAAIGWRWLRRDLLQSTTAGPAAAGPRLWSRAAARPGLRIGWTMLPVAMAGAAYSVALPAVASATLSRAELGLYYLADRIVRSLLAAADPVFQLVYPRIVQAFDRGLRWALVYALRWAVAGGLAGASLLGAAAFAWPLLAGALSSPGRGFDAQALHAVLSVLGWMLPLLLAWKFIGYWMLGSRRFDRAYRACVVIGGVAGVAGAAQFGSGGAVALARVALTVEVIVIFAALAGIWLTQRASQSARG